MTKVRKKSSKDVGKKGSKGLGDNAFKERSKKLVKKV